MTDPAFNSAATLVAEDDGLAKLLDIRNWFVHAVTRMCAHVEGADIVWPGFEFTLGERHCWMNIWEVEEDMPIPKKLRQRLVQVPSEIMKLAQRLTNAARKHGADIEWGGRDGFVFTFGGHRYWVEINYAVEAAELSQANDCGPELKKPKSALFGILGIKPTKPEPRRA